MRENLKNIKIERLHSFSTEKIAVDILRLDLIHPVVSGNKWFKLQFYIEEALGLGKQSIATFGGAYSNHIIATAYMASLSGLKSIGFIRGEENRKLSTTLHQAKEYGMDFIFLTREQYRNKEFLSNERENSHTYWIMEGGYGINGAKGAGTILNFFDTGAYTHILCAVGTGTMMAGLIGNASENQQIVGISVLKNHSGLEKDIRHLLSPVEEKKSFSLHYNYHLGGYAKQNESLLNFMKQIWETDRIPTDFVYTAKLLYGAYDLLQSNFFPPESRLLLIHSGGLQGNHSIAAGILPF